MTFSERSGVWGLFTDENILSDVVAREKLPQILVHFLGR
jgi:hypothetical protein